jgi:two-component system chemotaxis response regulator CheB
LYAVLVGGSAGSIDALSALLSALPQTFRIPVIAVVHLPRNPRTRLPEVLAGRTAWPVSMAIDKQPLMTRHLVLAPPDYHLLLDDGPCLALSVDAPVHYSRPSIDVLLESGARVLGAGAAGVVLSGASHDGAQGLAAIARAGGLALVQDPTQSAFPAMPRAALAQCPGATSLTISAIADVLARRQGASDAA